MDSTNIAPPPQPASTPSQPPPTLPLPASPTIAAPTTRAQKRKLDTTDGPAHKRLQIESPLASLPEVLLEPAKINPHTLGDDRNHDPKTESVSQDNGLPTQSPSRHKVRTALGDSRDHGSEIHRVIEDQDIQTQRDTRSPDSPLVESNRCHQPDNRYCETEDLLLSKPQRSPTAELSKANLKQLEQEILSLEEMDNPITPSDRGRKRAPSRQTSSSDLASTRSKEPTSSHSFYRYSILDRANVYILPESPPETLQAQLDIIFKRDVTEERRRQISDMAKEKSRNFTRLLRGSHREDDLVELVHQALYDMHKDESLTHPRKADWNPDLKPAILQQRFWNLDTWGRQDAEVSESLDRASKRQQADRPFPSPDTSQSTMPPPTAPRPAGNAAQLQSIQDGAVKTPRPDITWGFHRSAITNALKKRGLSEYQANRFLEALQREQKLCSDPTQHFLAVRFPILVIEGKAYATGKTLFEAENQAAVSGSSMLILQRQLEHLHDNIVLDSNVDREKSPFAFSLCTQGPIMELWVHHIVSDADGTEYHMNLLATCHGSLCGELERFLIQIDCLIGWYKHDFLGEIADQLFAITSHIAR
ncbi:MAG: hypothetical protein Q9213_004769 [Squamulea squamosa]